MAAVPPEIPVIFPDAEPTFTNALAELQVPPPTPSPSVIVDPWHTDAGPVMPVGVVLTVTITVAGQPATV